MTHSKSLRLALQAATILGAFALGHSALADSISVGSGVSTVTFTGTGSGTAVVYTGTTPYSVANYAAPAPGTLYITYDNSTEYLPSNTTTIYSVSFNGEGGGTGTLQFTADDSSTAYLNGSLIGSTTSFSSLTTDPLTFLAGTNTLTFAVVNGSQPSGAANPTALDFLATGTVAPTPEPGSLVLLGTGLLGVAGAARRRFIKA